tara:strand:- start:177 stop:788 length:612 start_codon:yes stop_codon:yes gene_type:complete
MKKINFIHIPKNGGTSIKTICSNNKHMIYRHHRCDVFNRKLPNTLIVIRNPIERFISAVNYSLQKWSHKENIKYLIRNKIDTPNKFVEIWMDKNHKEYSNLMKLMKNEKQKIGNKMIEYKWTYYPQYNWINNPKFVIVMDNLNEELRYFMDKYNIKGKIIQNNKTSSSHNILSEKSKKFLMKFYKKDIEIYNKYKNISMENRL